MQNNYQIFPPKILYIKGIYLGFDQKYQKISGSCESQLNTLYSNSKFKLLKVKFTFFKKNIKIFFFVFTEVVDNSSEVWGNLGQFPNPNVKFKKTYLKILLYFHEKELYFLYFLNFDKSPIWPTNKMLWSTWHIFQLQH